MNQILFLRNKKAAAGPAFSPTDLFDGTSDGSSGTENGAWFDFSDQSTLWTTTGRTANPSVGGEVRYVDDKSGNGNDIQRNAATWEWQTDYIVRTNFGSDPASFSYVSTPPTGITTLFAAMYWLDDTQTGYRGIMSSSSAMLLSRGATDRLSTFGGADYPSSYEITTAAGGVVVGMSGGTFYENGNTASTYAATGNQNDPLGGDSGQETNMRVYQALYINRTLTTAELADLQTYFASKIP